MSTRAAALVEARTLARGQRTAGARVARSARAPAEPLPEFTDALIGRDIDSCWAFKYRVRTGGWKYVNKWCAGQITGLVHPTADAKGKMTVPFIQIAFTDGDVQMLQADRPHLWIVKKPGSWRWFSDAGKQPVNEDEFTDVESDEFRRRERH